MPGGMYDEVEEGTELIPDWSGIPEDDSPEEGDPHGGEN